jgi:hypothetical protein
MNTNSREISIGPTLRLLPSSPAPENGKLPILTSAADIRELIQYLKRRPAGVIAAEELDRPRKKLFDDRKLAAYEFLGITTREGKLLRLSALGWNFAQRLAADAEMFRHLLDRHPPYFTALTSIALQNLDLITSTELCDFWHGAHSDAFEFADHEAIRGAVVSFFSLCQAAGLGTMVLGKRGHITRFFVDRDELTRFLNNGPAAPSDNEDAAHADSRPFVGPLALNNPGGVPTADAPELTVLIQCKNPLILELIQRTLAVANLRGIQVSAIWDRTNSTADVVENHSREFCALIVVLGEEAFITDREGTSGIKQNLLLELGAAHVLYDRRVIVLADKTSAVGAGLEDLISFAFDSERLDWAAGLQLIKQLAEFRERIQRPLLAAAIPSQHECHA